MGFRLLRLHGHKVSTEVYEHFKKGSEFFSYPEQSNQAVTAMHNLYRASQVAFPGEKILGDAKEFATKFLREKQASNELLDKWIITKDLPGELVSPHLTQLASPRITRFTRLASPRLASGTSRNSARLTPPNAPRLALTCLLRLTHLAQPHAPHSPHSSRPALRRSHHSARLAPPNAPHVTQFASPSPAYSSPLTDSPALPRPASLASLVSPCLTYLAALSSPRPHPPTPRLTPTHPPPRPASLVSPSLTHLTSLSSPRPHPPTPRLALIHLPHSARLTPHHSPHSSRLAPPHAPRVLLTSSSMINKIKVNVRLYSQTNGIMINKLEVGTEQSLCQLKINQSIQATMTQM
ncbi:hypothetical protein ACLB2K_015787 [Fragaria x ananassa]